MRALRLAFSCLGLLSLGCNDTEPQGFPTNVRACGELDGVAPVEPMVVGEHPQLFGLDGSCPIFEPVPCTSELDAYDALCGPDCWPATATHRNGDEWLIGCEYNLPTPCGQLDYVPQPECYRDPFVGEEFWYTYPSCPIVLEAIFCWTPCTPDERWPDPPEYCPER